MCETQTNIAKARRARARILNDQRKKRPPVNVAALVAVVDDEPSVRKGLTRLIRTCGLRVKSFSSGRELVRAVAHLSPDCVVLDVHMLDMSGWEVHRHLKYTNADIPVIVISGEHNPKAHALAERNGAQEYLSKPVDADLLIGAIKTAIGSKRRAI